MDRQPREQLHPAALSPALDSRGDMVMHKVLVLVGGGHAHVQVVCALSTSKLPSVKRVLISDAHVAYYSGMLPAVVAGLCEEERAQVHLPSLCEAHGWTFVHGRVSRVDTERNVVYFRPGPADHATVECPLPFSALSLNVGSTTRAIGPAARTPDPGAPGPLSIAQAADFTPAPQAPVAVIYTRPIAQLVHALRAFETRWKAAGKAVPAPDVLVVGAGAAGLELTLALHTRFSRTLGRVHMALVSHNLSFASEHGQGPGAAALAEVQRRGVSIMLKRGVTSLDETTGCAVLDNGARRAFHVAVVATGASPHAGLAALGLPLDADGWLLVQPTLQCKGAARVFAVGDCASFGGLYGAQYPPKAGVFAVRQGPFLTHNLQVALGVAGPETQGMREYVPQTSFLSLLSTGDGRGIGSKYGLTFKGTWVFRLKMYIDEAWQQRFRVGASGPGGDGAAQTVPGDEHVEFDGTPAQGAALLLASEDIQPDDSFDRQLSVLRRMDKDEEFREGLLSQLSEDSTTTLE